jgi:hypothetical protein
VLFGVLGVKVAWCIKVVTLEQRRVLDAWEELLGFKEALGVCCYGSTAGISAGLRQFMSRVW